MRLGFFLAILVAMVVFETWFPRRKRRFSRFERWPCNLSLSVINAALVRFVVPASVVGVAQWCGVKEFGLFNWISLPHWMEMLFVIVLLDMVIYWQHVVFHRLPILWRLHRVHHADPDLDVTSGARFHTIEILMSVGVKIVAVAVMGAAPVAVMAFEVILNGMAMFNHSNVRIPLGLDRVLRYLVVTPDMHRVHHSVLREEHDRNFGFNLAIWDRVFGSYLDQPSSGHDGMTIGLNAFPGTRVSGSLRGALMMPWHPDR